MNLNKKRIFKALKESQELLERRRLKQQQYEPQKIAENKNKSSSLPKSSNSTLQKPNGLSSKKPAPPESSTIAVKEKKVKKPQYSYQEMLNLANKLNEEKLKSLETPQNQPNKCIKSAKPPPNLPEIKQKLNNKIATQQASSSQASNVKRYLPGDIRSNLNQFQETSKLKAAENKNHPIDSQKTKKSSSISGKTTSVVTNPENNNQSAWDRAIADLKRKSCSNLKAKDKKDGDYYDQAKYEVEDEEEEENDSDMDSFICDDDDEDRELSSVNNENKNYSKYIREIFKYNPERYKHLNDDDDDINMEASYKDILQEEYKSTKYGYLEDLEDMKLEEEEKKRMIKKNKKMKIK